MEPLVDWCGLPILWHIDAELVGFHLACLCVLSVFKKEITKAMISTCSGTIAFYIFDNRAYQQYSWEIRVRS